jgi:hypothetical protein
MGCLRGNAMNIIKIVFLFSFFYATIIFALSPIEIAAKIGNKEELQNLIYDYSRLDIELVLSRALYQAVKNNHVLCFEFILEFATTYKICISNIWTIFKAPVFYSIILDEEIINKACLVAKRKKYKEILKIFKAQDNKLRLRPDETKCCLKWVLFHYHKRDRISNQMSAQF